MRVNTLLIFISLGLLFGISSSQMVQAQSQAEEDEMIRILMLPEAEVTGMYVDEHGRFFVNAMHPDPDNYDATIGVINGLIGTICRCCPRTAASSQATDVARNPKWLRLQVLLQAGDTLSDGRLAGHLFHRRWRADSRQSEAGFQCVHSDQSGWNKRLSLHGMGRWAAGIGQIEIQWDSTSSQWDVISSQMLNLSSINGGWVLCFC